MGTILNVGFELFNATDWYFDRHLGKADRATP